MEPTKLLHKLRREPGVSDELLLLLGVPQKLDDAEVDHANHRRVAGDEHKEGDLHGICFLEGPLSDLLDYELADEVVLGLGGAGVYEAAEVAEEFPGDC